MEREFIPYEIALTLKELGFDEPCLGNYQKTGGLHILHYGTCGSTKSDNFNILAPLYQQAFRWFLDNYGLFVETTLWGDGIGYMSQIKQIKKEEFLEVYNLGYVSPNRGLPNWDREKEELDCLKKLIEIVKQ